MMALTLTQYVYNVVGLLVYCTVSHGLSSRLESTLCSAVCIASCDKKARSKQDCLSVANVCMFTLL